MREKEIEHELGFWKEFVKTPRFLDGWVRGEKTPELHEDFHKWMQQHDFSSILDVGSGVVSILHGATDYSVMAVDPLGDEYAKIFDYPKWNLISPFPLKGEEVGDHFSDIDLVHISNALDHAEDPRAVVNSCMRSVNDGGFFAIQSFENEADHMNREGMHQHNIRLTDNVLYLNDMPLLSNPVFAKAYPDHYQGRTWIIYIVQK